MIKDTYKTFKPKHRHTSTHMHSARQWPVLGAQDKDGGDWGRDKDTHTHTHQSVLGTSGINNNIGSRCLCWAACGSDGWMDGQMD